MRPREIAAFLYLGAVWGASFLFIRIAAPVLGPFPLMAGRVVAAAGALWAFAAVRRAPVTLRPYWRRLLVLGFLNAAAPFALIAAAEIHLTASMAAVLLAVTPLFVMLLGAVWLGERLSAARIAGLLLGVAGVAVLVGWTPGRLDGTALLSAGAVLLAAVSYAAGALYSRHRLHDAPVFSLALGQQLGAAAWLLVPGVLAAPRASVSGAALGALAALALLSTSVAYVVFFWLIERAGAVRTSTVTYVIPLFGVLWGALFLGEPITPGLAGGLGCILLSLGVVHFGRSVVLRPPVVHSMEAVADDRPS